MPAYRINEVIACHWVINDVEIVKVSEIENKRNDALKLISQINKRRKPKFNF